MATMITVSPDETGPSRSGEEAAWRLVVQSCAIDHPRYLPSRLAGFQRCLTPTSSGTILSSAWPGPAVH